MGNHTVSLKPHGRLGVCALVVATVLAGPAEAAQVTFTDVTAAAGLLYMQRDGPAVIVQPYFQDVMTGGAAVCDLDGDGRPDIVYARFDAPLMFFRNNGNGTFTDVAAQSGAPNERLSSGANGVACGDIDNDGDVDVYVSSIETSRFDLFINDGAGTFDEQALLRGVALEDADPHFGEGITLGDYDGDGYLDLFVAEWRIGDALQNPAGLLSHNRLLRNLGTSSPGHFEDVTLAAGILLDDNAKIPWSDFGLGGFSPRFSDLDDDGCVDLSWCADTRQSRLFWNNCDGTFTDGTMAAGVGDERNCMGSTHDDFDGDGQTDWFVTAIADNPTFIRRGNRLYINNGDRTFTDSTDAAGVRDGGWGWGAAGIDYDNDGDVDIVHTNGMPFVDDTYWAADPMRFFENDGSGGFSEIAASIGLTDTGSGRAIVVLDYDGDGDSDVFIVNHGDYPVLYRNDGGNENGWLQVALVGSGHGNTSQGIGAQVSVTLDLDFPEVFQRREMDIGSNFLGHDEVLLQFGLTGAQSIDELRVDWPNRQTTLLYDLAAKQRVTITAGAPLVCTAVTRESARLRFATRTGSRLIARGRLGGLDDLDMVGGPLFAMWMHQSDRGCSPEAGHTLMSIASRLSKQVGSRWLYEDADISIAVWKRSRAGAPEYSYKVKARFTGTSCDGNLVETRLSFAGAEVLIPVRAWRGSCNGRLAAYRS